MFPLNVEVDSITFIFLGALNDNDNSVGAQRMSCDKETAAGLEHGSRPRPGVNVSSPGPLPGLCFHLGH